MRVMDCVLILFRRKLIKMESDPTVPSPLPSWQESLKIMSGTSFLSDLLNYPKDTINDEMVELLEPYFTMEDYNTATANRVCRYFIKNHNQDLIFENRRINICVIFVVFLVRHCLPPLVPL